MSTEATEMTNEEFAGAVRTPPDAAVAYDAAWMSDEQFAAAAEAAYALARAEVAEAARSLTKAQRAAKAAVKAAQAAAGGHDDYR